MSNDESAIATPYRSRLNTGYVLAVILPAVALAAPTADCPSGQRELTVNQPALAFEGSNPSSATAAGGSTGLRKRGTECRSDLRRASSDSSPDGPLGLRSRLERPLSWIDRRRPGSDHICAGHRHRDVNQAMARSAAG